MASENNGSRMEDDQDLRQRFEKIAALDTMKTKLLEDVLTSNDMMREQLTEFSKKRKRDTQDLEIEQNNRRKLQDEVSALTATVNAMKRGKFILVLVDADAQTNLFHDGFLSRGVEGGQAAANALIEKVQDYFINGLGASIEKTKALPIMIKAYANLQGLSQFCVRDQRLSSPAALSSFWIGFSRSSPLVDFVDVGPGKEEADNKLRQVLDFYINNPQCTHIMLICCHDAGYVPVLRPYSTQKILSQRITLVSTGGIYPSMAQLGFRSTNIFEPLFSAKGSSQLGLRSKINNLPQPLVSEHVQEQTRQAPLGISQLKTEQHAQASPIERTTNHRPSSPTSTSPRTEFPIPRPFGPENFVANSDRLRPVLRNSAGKRVDKKLPYHMYDERVQKIRSLNICSWHYLRSDHKSDNCRRSHDAYPRPLSSEDYDALWLLARKGFCNRMKMEGDCDDDQCIYGHGLVES
ncbi:hypothetical protein BKA65DRAFT_511460 [Rhexocercosporidium sp. MPI-PUGE-AT-0058]|nr:hypothetical protein BKA65DRAFT_511460 [Rhexocercosporidium sp. MPI-PUGE-AT-0058]